MALQRSKELSSGVLADYWKVEEIRFNLLDRTATVSVALFLNAASRESGKAPVDRVNYRWVSDAYPFSASALDLLNPIGIVYAKLKELEDFSGAVDV